ncbi:MAG: glutamate racemase [Proteobacteria bacterium]|nr:glutamate racemase [Pseudomonadota bacterium]
MKILMFDSGLGGLTVLAPVRGARPDADIIYLADDAVFPYGALGEAELVQRVLSVIEPVVARETPDIIINACNTASTLVLPHLRQRYSIPVVGTVPAIKPAAEQSKSRCFSVMATPGTVARDYTRELVEKFAAGCAVTLVPCANLARLAEQHLRGETVSDTALLAEMMPAFVEAGGQRTDTVVLACTHYPLLMDRMAALAPWPVTWIDPGPAIARRVVQLLGERQEGAAPAGPGVIHFTSGAAPGPALAATLAARGLIARSLP